MPNGLEISANIMKGIDRAAQNFTNIRQARQELEQEKELFNLQKKKSKLELQELEYSLDPEQLDLVKRKTEAETKLKEAEYEEKMTTIDTTEKQIKKEMQFLDQMMKQEGAYDRGRQDQRGLDLPGFRGREVRPEQDFRLPWEYKGERLTIKSPKERKEEKRDYLLRIPPKTVEEKKKTNWARWFGYMGAEEPEVATTITEAKRKYAAGEEMSSEEATLLVINNVKTKQDLEEILENRERYEEENVDVQKILDFFTAEEEEE